MAKIGIMSFAHVHAPGYAGCVNALPNASLVAVWDADARRGRAAAKAFQTTFIGDLDKFLGQDMDAVIITAENMKHCELAENAAAAGKWILCEKPLAATTEDAKAMVAACKKAGVGLGTAFPCRYLPSLMMIQRQIASGQLGELYAASCTNNGSYPGGWFADPELSGGGATMDHSVHVVDLLRWMTGKEFTRVYCESGTFVHPKLGTDDVGSLHLEMEDGLVVSLIASWNRCKSFPTWGDVTLEIIAEKGVINVDAFNQKLNVYSDKTMRAAWPFWGDNMDLGLVADFADAVDEKRPPTISGHDGLKATQVTEAAYKSAKMGKAVGVHA